MCGIAGIITLDKSGVSVNRLKAMTDVIAHRGPDGEGHWISPNGQVGLGHRRLSIIDLSFAANQPMHYLDRYSVVFNGEIYNYLELKDTLIHQGYKFKTQSDTEVLMALYDRYKAECLQLLDGMFSFAIWDGVEETLFCARDRFGEKPFFYFKKENTFLFSSEMKALWSAGIPKSVDNVMAFNYWFFDFVYNPNDLSQTFYKNIYSLEPSHYLVVDVNGNVLKKKKYWDIDHRIQQDNITLKQATEQFRELFYTSIKRRLRSDVSIGSSLSGGLDSSAIVCAINKTDDVLRQVTFSARFPNFIKDESKYIDIVLDHTNAQGYSCYPSLYDEAQFEKVMYHQEEPFGSTSILVQNDVMALAKQNNTIVLLDGQGADEILCGYHGFLDIYFRELKNTNPKLYKTEYDIFKEVHKNNKINNTLQRTIASSVKDRLSDAQISKILGIRASIRELIKPSEKRDFFQEYKKSQFIKKYNFASLNEALYFATTSGALQELLKYADRNSMAHSREIRLPFLYHELVTFIFSLPATLKFHRGFTKYILRKSMESIMPESIVWRKDKIGYEPPSKNTLRSSKNSPKIENSADTVPLKSAIMSNIEQKG